MSTPYNGNEDDFWDKENEGSGDLPRYGSTNHPEDRPDYGQGGYAQSGNGQPYSSGYDSNYGNAGYSGAQFGGAGYSENLFNNGSGQRDLVETDGKLQVFSAIGFGFKRTFSNAKLWLLGSLAFIVVSFILGGIVGAIFGNDAGQTGGGFELGTDLAGNIVSLISLALMPFVYRLATKEVDSRSTGWSALGKDVYYFPTLAITFILSLISLVFSFFVVTVILGSFFAQLEAAGTDEVEFYNSLAANIGTFLGILMLIMVGYLLVTPLYQLMVWYAADGRAGIGQSIVQGFRSGAANYFRLIGFNIAISVVMVFITLVTLGLGMIIALPVYLLAQAHAYRQIAGGPVPFGSIDRS
ncbi:MAG: hypothetical protein ACTIKY_02410 [Corynebacterium casei]|uniref:hypothetical protein n=1 Tax=Corynebacterium casei TaxID=160386 RepID=UPI0009CE07A6|nr:hypothetical protein [Corynebacterium casei]MDN5784618.1 hypothetical protein [Corynebacterium casei]MDN5799463.1 hypothetical protein [Corynebacterium casei]MDN5825856.1 hypothetical protein [Corynebacterium casei]MDN5921857.1 hypothetical protein [Corynebacterium casei]MDN6262170.1 hypothetical protein [Corynebacterium casei]